MKRLCFLLTLIILIGIFSGCQNTESHIIEKDGKYYFLSDDIPNRDANSSSSDSEVLACVAFSSVDEMLTDIKTGNFTDDELYEIGKFERLDDGLVKLFDLNLLYEPYHPTAFENASRHKVFWYGDHYDFVFRTDYAYIIVRPTTQEYNDSYYSRYTSDDSQYSPIHKEYTIPSNDGHYRVIEVYGLYGKPNSLPDYITLLIDKEDQHLFVSLRDLKELPSEEWLAQFALIEYTPN